MTTPLLSVSDGSRTTVSDLIGNPLMIPARILDVLATNFLGETLLRDAGPNGNGLVSFHSSTPLYLDSTVEDVAEFAEIPVGVGQIGLPRIAYAIKRGLGVRVSLEMRDENRMDAVNLQITQLRNSMVRAEDRVLRQLLTDPAIPTIAATAAWDTSTAKIRRDYSRAMEVIAAAKPATAGDDEIFGFEADTTVMHGSVVPVLQGNDEFNRVYEQQMTADDIRYSGKLPNQILGLDPLKSRSFPRDRVLVLERNTVGFYSDTRPLGVTPLYGEGGGPNGGPTETWRADATRKRAMGLDQPLAACWITGVQAA